MVTCQAILLGILPQGLCRAVLCDEDLQVALDFETRRLL